MGSYLRQAERHPRETHIVVATREILVLVIDDDGLRSMLSARLALEGELLATYDGSVDGEGPARLPQEPAILITDDTSVADAGGWFAEAENWGGRILVGAGGSSREGPGNFAIVDRASAVPQICTILQRWRRRAGERDES